MANSHLVLAVCQALFQEFYIYDGYNIKQLNSDTIYISHKKAI